EPEDREGGEGGAPLAEPGEDPRGERHPQQGGGGEHEQAELGEQRPRPGLAPKEGRQRQGGAAEGRPRAPGPDEARNQERRGEQDTAPHEPRHGALRRLHERGAVHRRRRRGDRRRRRRRLHFPGMRRLRPQCTLQSIPSPSRAISAPRSRRIPAKIHCRPRVGTRAIARAPTPAPRRTPRTVGTATPRSRSPRAAYTKTLAAAVTPTMKFDVAEATWK